jgi:hypothetical protein
MLIETLYNAVLRLPHLIWFAGIFCLVMSCLPDPLEVDSVPRAKQEIVVSTQMMTDESVLVLLTRTFGALDAHGDSDPQALLDFIAVNDAIVTIEGPVRKDTLRFLRSGAYGGVFIPFETGETYHLHVKSNSMGEVHARTEAKRQIDFQSVEAGLYYNVYNDTLAQIRYTLRDPPEHNWYMINVQEVEREDFIENLLNPRAFTMLLPDEEFNGSAYGEIFRVFPRDYHPGDSIAVSLSNISEEYYEFMKLRIDNRFSFVEFVSEPVDYPSNVVGGKGYFNLYLPDIRFFVFD